MLSDKQSNSMLEVVGRDSRIDLQRYTVTICGRELIDYDKLNREEPLLYKQILKQEHEQNRIEHKY